MFRSPGGKKCCSFVQLWMRAPGILISLGGEDLFCVVFCGKGDCERETFLLLIRACGHNQGSSDHQTGYSILLYFFLAGGGEASLRVRWPFDVRACTRGSPGRVDFFLFLDVGV